MNPRLQHVTISRPPGGDDAARTFYGNALGLTEVAPPRSLAALDLIWYRLAGDTELHILVEEPMGQDHTGRHFCLAVDDIVDLRARLDAVPVDAMGTIMEVADIPFGYLAERNTIHSFLNEAGWKP